MNQTVPLTSFTGGEWSPRLHGRVDIQKYNTACEVLQNMVIYPHGGVTRRMGMELIEDAKTDSVRLIPFEYNREQAYVLEFGENYIRFFRNSGQIQYMGAPLELATTFLASELESISFAQSNDVMYIVHEKHAPMKLERTGPDVFTLTAVTFTAQPAEWIALNYPRVVTFFQSRLVMGACPNNPQTLWLSKVSDLQNFTTGSNANDSLKYTLSSTRNNAIQWIVPSTRLMIGTIGGEFTLDLPSNNGLNVQVKQESSFGSYNGRTQLVGSGVIYISRDRKKLREMTYSFEADGYVSPELSLLSEHLTRSGIKEYDFAQNPDGILWTVMGDGSFCGFTYLKSQEVQAWHRHETSGMIKSICSIEGSAGSEVWFAVLRNGAVRIEKMAEAFEGDSPDDIKCAYLDSFISYEGAAVDELSGLGHLEGQTVSVLGDGLWLTDKTVIDGMIVLEKECSKIVVGLKYAWRVIPLRLEGGSPNGFAQGKRKRLESVTVRVERSSGINHKVKDGDYQSQLPARRFGDNFDECINLKTGDIKIPMHGNWGKDGQFELFGDSPFPVTILMLAPNVVVNE